MQELTTSQACPLLTNSFMILFLKNHYTEKRLYPSEVTEVSSPQIAKMKGLEKTQEE